MKGDFFMARHKVEISGVNTANIKVLTTEEMNELFKRVKNGDTKAREELVNGNLKLVLSILKKFSKHVDNMDDLFQIGCIGLLKAIDNFDLSYGVKFSTYCVPMIQGEVKRYLRDNNSIRVSRSVKDLAYKALKLKEELTMEDNSEPTTERLAELLEVETYNIVNALESMRDPISIFEPIYNDGGDTIYLVDQLEDKKNMMYSIDDRMALKSAINTLNSKEKEIIIKRYIIGKTQMELAEEFGISQAQISRIEKNSLEKVKKMII